MRHPYHRIVMAGLVCVGLYVACGDPHQPADRGRAHEGDTMAKMQTAQGPASPKDDTMAMPPGHKETEFQYDTLHPTGYRDISGFRDDDINGIRFGDCDTITSLFGDTYRLIPDDDDDLPRIQVLTTDRSQLLTMFMDNGDAQCSFHEYQIEYRPAHPHFRQKPFTLKVARFISGNGIALGMTYAALRAKFGKPNVTERVHGLVKRSYQEYNGLYFGDYYFKQDTLMKFRYGTEYP